MSNESSASETTPLRRPESLLSAAESTTNVASNSKNNNNTRHLNNIPPTAQTELDAPSDSVYNNFRIEERLNTNNNNNHSEPQQPQQPQQQQQQRHKKDMDTNKRILCRVGLDVLILLCGE